MQPAMAGYRVLQVMVSETLLGSTNETCPSNPPAYPPRLPNVVSNTTDPLKLELLFLTAAESQVMIFRGLGIEADLQFTLLQCKLLTYQGRCESSK